MIGVLPKPSQIAAVSEFFELFKTAWQLYQPGCHYDVVIVTVDQVPAVDARLVLILGAGTKNTDVRHQIQTSAVQPRGTGHDRDEQPIYGDRSVLIAASGWTACVETATGTLGVRRRCADRTVIRLGFDFFDETRILLTEGQPPENAHIPALDNHIELLRKWILEAGVPLVEILPVPAGHAFSVCLTHDIDFVAIRNHPFDHTMWGFLYRSTLGGLRDCLRGRVSVGQLAMLWRAALSLPLVFAGWVRDFWEPFAWYLSAEDGLPSTHFLIPFKGRSGERVSQRHASRRAAKYEVADLRREIETLQAAGCEIGVHGLDAWNSARKGSAERAKLEAVTGGQVAGIRMHWLLRDGRTPALLEQAGYAYDSTTGYNETVGYRAGTTQVYRPLGTATLMELPIHIQDGALFYRHRLDLSAADAERRCAALIDHAERSGGVLTVLWHDRSHAPERMWGAFYVRLIAMLRASKAWFGTASQVVAWFRARRRVRFEASDPLRRVLVPGNVTELNPPMVVRFHQSPTTFVDKAWNAMQPLEWDGSEEHLHPLASDAPALLVPAVT